MVVEIFLPPHIFMRRAQCIAPHGINRDFIRRNILRPTILDTNLCFLKLFGQLRCANRPYKITIFLWMEAEDFQIKGGAE